MRTLLVDIGNSAIKFGIGKSGTLKISKTLRTGYEKKNLIATIEKTVAEKYSDNAIDLVGISLLDKALRKKILNLFFRLTGVIPEFISPESDLPFQLKYALTIGSDRLCSSAAGVMISEKKNVLVIDFGTATTYTIVNKSKLVGGMISPGIGTAHKALLANTGLPDSKLEFPETPFSGNTVKNINGGVLYQSLYCTERYIKECRGKFGETLVIATGGFSSLIFRKTSQIDIIEPYLVLKGINVIISK